jgi:two-component system cell cycle response regulator
MTRVLAVDDNEAHCYALRRILENAGYEVLHAANGSEALEIALREKPDVVLLDINMPGLNGYEVCSRLKADERTAKTSVVFHTATDATSSARSYAETVGATAFLTYPINTDHLLSVVQGAAARSKST